MSQNVGSPKGRKTYRRPTGSDSPKLNDTRRSGSAEESESDTSEDEAHKEAHSHNSRDYTRQAISTRRTFSPSPSNLNEKDSNSRRAAERSPSPIIQYTHETYTSVTRRTASPLSHQAKYNSPKIQQSPPVSIKSDNSSARAYIIAITLVLLLAVGISVGSGFVSTSVEDVRKNCSNIDSLKLLHPSQDKYLWRAVKTGIEAVLNGKPPKPSIFLFLHQNEQSTQQIIQDIVNAAAECFDPTLKAVVLDSEEFNSEDVLNDHGTVIERYREALSSGGVVFIADLNKIPGKAAKALHFICDNENPIINNVVIFLTLKPISDIGKPVEIAEDTLNSIWSSSIDKNTLSALVARVTDQVIKLHPE